MPRIALIHALAHSIEPINSALARDWPEAMRMNLLDDSLSADLAARAVGKGGLDAAMTARFVALGDYAVAAGADALLFTCSAFGPCIDAVARRHGDRPVLKPNAAMIAEAVECHRRDGRPIGLVATFGPTLESMPAEFPRDLPLRTALAEGALAALDAGDLDRHDALAAEAAARLAAAGCGAVALAQFSLARARPVVAGATGLPVLTTPDSAVRALRLRLSSC
jgi:hypothetical protein